MYFLYKNKNMYEVTSRRRRTKGWIIYSKNYTDLKRIAENLTKDIPKVCLKRIDLTNTILSSIESSSKEYSYDSEYCTDLNYEVSNNSEDLDNESNASISQSFNKNDESNTSESNLEGEATYDNVNLSVFKSAERGTENLYDSEDYNDSDYEVFNNSEDSDNESNASISQSFNKNGKSNTSKSNLDASQLTYEGKATCDDTNLIVPKSTKKSDKKFFCKYCKKLQTKLVRHLETVHKNELEVKKFSLLPKGNLERRTIIDVLRKESNFIYNTSSLFNAGDLIVSRRPSKVNKPASAFTCCPKCKGFFSKNGIRHHFRKCNKKSIGKKLLILSRKVQARIHNKASDTVRNVIFPVLRDDNVCRVIRYDELVILHANKLCRKYRNQRHHDVIRAELRLLGRFLISIRNFNPNITDFASIYQPRHYDSCLLASKDVAQFDSDNNTFKAPSIATRLGGLLKKLGNLLITEYIKQDNDDLKNVVHFLQLLEENYGTLINKIAKKTVSKSKRHDEDELPDMEDIQKLYNYLQEKIHSDILTS